MNATPLVEMINIHKRFGGVHAVKGVSIDLYPGEVNGILGHNGAGKTVLMKALSGAIPCDEGEIRISGEKVRIESPRDARKYGIETIYQTLALADNLDAPGNLFLGREMMTQYGTLNDRAMENEARKVIHRLNPNFQNITDAVKNMSGGQRQSIAIARAIYFNAKILIMDEPTAALGPQETAMVSELIKQLKSEGIGIFLISHDLHDVFDLSDRVSVIKNGQLIGTRRTQDVTKDEVLGMIIMGKLPEQQSA
jgi:D-xylose transport system ATP-binding protein